SNKRTTDNSTSSALSQHDLPQPLQTVPVVLDESNTTLDIEADSSSASKKFKSNDHETSTDAEIQPFSKNDIGLFVVDATSDISGTEQLSLSIRYLSRDNNQIQIKEEFIGFTPLSDSSAKGIFEKIIEYLRSTGLDLTYLRGQGYDGCSVMSGHIGGVQKLISDTAPRALYPYTEVLQSKNYDLAQCYDNIEEVAIYLAELKYDVTKFHELETELEHFAGENDITLTLPRTNKYENVNAYVKTIYETFIETTLTELGNRFSKHKKILVNVFNLLPSYVVEKEFNDVKQAFDFYKDDLPSNDMNVLAAEFEMW
ncbi:unnamed protein product, partial [Rotaria sordida]